MAFRVYKRKPTVAEKIKADQVTVDTMYELVNQLSGRVKTEKISGETVNAGIEFPTMDGIKTALLGEWIIRHDHTTYEIVSNEKFTETWEVARNTQQS